MTGVLEAAESGEIARLAFAVPAGATWALPAYELALLTREHLCERGAGAVEVLVVTPEPRPLSLFGEAASAELEVRLDAAGIEAHTLSRVRSHDGGRLELEGGGHLRADRVVSLPRLKGPALAGLPHDDEGFIPVDDHGRVRGVDGVYAAGDCTAFPMKQGGLAAQQADAVAESIAFDLGAARLMPFTAVLRGLLLTGGHPDLPACLARGRARAIERRDRGDRSTQDGRGRERRLGDPALVAAEQDRRSSPRRMADAAQVTPRCAGRARRSRDAR